MEINILIEDEFKGRITRKQLIDIAKKVLTSENTGDNIEMGILITTQEKIKELNRIYRHINEPTDVLSFFMVPEKEQSPVTLKEIFITPPDNVRHLGEVIISYPQAKIQAVQQKHTVKDEIITLLVHGTLHLLGYDHEAVPDRNRMKIRETAILKTIQESI